MSWNGIILACLLASIVAIGAVAPPYLGTNITLFMQALAARIGNMPMVGSIVVALLVFGMAAVAMSTIDNLIVGLTYFVRENVMRRSSSANIPQDLGRVRRLTMLLFLISFVPLTLLFSLSPDVFYLLLGIGSGAIVFAPLVVALGLLTRIDGAIRAASNQWLSLFGFFFVFAWGLSFFFVRFQPPFVPYLSLIMLLISSTAATALYCSGKRMALLELRARAVGANANAGEG
jgi:hypothetical protein